jgi:hypothetical protein
MPQLVNYSILEVKRRRQLTGSLQYVSTITPELELVLTYYMLKSSLKKIMTMLGRVRRRQEDENLEIHTSRPAKTSRTEDFYKAVMVQSQRLRLEYAIKTSNYYHTENLNRSQNFDITKGTILDSELRPEHFSEVTAAIFREVNQCTLWLWPPLLILLNLFSHVISAIDY